MNIELGVEEKIEKVQDLTPEQKLENAVAIYASKLHSFLDSVYKYDFFKLYMQEGASPTIKNKLVQLRFSIGSETDLFLKDITEFKESLMEFLGSELAEEFILKIKEVK